MKIIYKYSLQIEDEQTIAMRKGARILTAQMQGTKLCLWAECEEQEYPAETEQVRIEIHCTGHRFPDGPRQYIATVQHGPMVLHVYRAGVTP